MAIPFMNLPRPGDGVSSLMDFAPLAAALQTYNQGSDMARKRANMSAIGQTTADKGIGAGANQALQMGELDAGLEMKPRASADEDKFKKRMAAMSQAVDLEPDPARKGVMWNRVLKALGDTSALSPEEMDPMTGPKLLMAEAGIVNDPMDRRLKEAQIAKYQADARNAGSDYGKAGTVVQGGDGKFYTVQFGSDGSRKIEPLNVGETTLTPSRGVAVSGNQMYDRATGSPVRDMTSALAGGEQAKAEGKAAGAAVAGLPKAEMAYKMFEDKSQRLEETIDRAIARVSPWTTGAGGMLSGIPGTEAKALAGDLDTIRANVGFDELSAMRAASPTGGALGSVTERENILLQSVRASIDQLQGGENVKQNLGIIKQSVAELRKIQAEKLAADRARLGAAAAPAIAPGEYVWNPATGKVEPRQ